MQGVELTLQVQMILKYPETHGSWRSNLEAPLVHYREWKAGAVFTR